MASKSSSTTSLPPSCLSETNTTSFHSLNLKYNPRPKKLNDGEIDVFSADKYFSGGIDRESNIRVRKNPTDKPMIDLSKLKLQPRTPSVQSGLSLNSQSVLLLRPVQKTPCNSNSNNITGEKKSSFLSCYYCCNRKSVDIIDHDAFQNGLEMTRLQSDTFAIRTSDPLTSVNMVSWDAIPRSSVEQINTSGRSGPPSGTSKDSTESDAISDLFEIECVSCTASPIGHDQILESDGSAAPTTGFAPSEASIEWSVITASAADFSIVSDLEDQGSTITSVTRGRAWPTPKSRSSVKELLNKKGDILSGCKSQKAVRVAGGDVYACTDKRKSSGSQKIHRFSSSYSPVTRFQVEAKLPETRCSQSNRICGSTRLYNV